MLAYLTLFVLRAILLLMILVKPVSGCIVTVVCHSQLVRGRKDPYNYNTDAALPSKKHAPLTMLVLLSKFLVIQT